MEHKIGEIFEVEGQWYQCVRSITCSGCGFANGGCIADKHLTGDCSGRLDAASVIFKKLEKIGKPYLKNVEDNTTYQMYKLPMNVNELICQCYWVSLITSNIVEIEQTKEEDNKLNLKPFDLQKAKADKPVCTRDGRKARIICFDRNYLYEEQNYPIVVLIKGPYGETIYSYTKDGLYYPNTIHDNDLMMLCEKKEGYVNLYHNSNDKYAAYLGNNVIYKDKEFAEKMGKDCSNYIKTIKVEWYE